MFPHMYKTKLVKGHTIKVKECNEWVDVHCRVSIHYRLQIRQCADCVVLHHRRIVSDPVHDVNGNHYKSFESTYGVETTEDDRPTLMKNPEKTEPANAR